MTWFRKGCPFGQTYEDQQSGQRAGEDFGCYYKKSVQCASWGDFGNDVFED